MTAAIALVTLLAGRPAAGEPPAPAGGDGLARVLASGVLRWGGDTRRAPGLANDFIALLKDTSLVSVITVVELTKQMTITAVYLQSWLVPGLLCAALYLALSYPLARLARRIERHLAPVPT